MATSDILTRLVLDISGFDKQLGKSKKEVEQWKKGIEKTGKEIANTMKGIAAGAGIAVSATEAFKTAMNSADSVADKYKGTILGLKTAVNEFFHTIMTGDFSQFNKGISEMVRNAQSAVASLKELSNVGTAFSFVSSEDDADLTDIMTELRSGNVSKSRRAELTAQANALIAKRQGNVQSMSSTAEKAVRDNLAASSGASAGQFNMDQVRRIYTEFLLNPSSTERVNQYKDYLRQQSAIDNQYSVTKYGFQGSSYTQLDPNNPKYKEATAALQSQFMDAIVYNALFESTANGGGLSAAIQGYQTAQGERRTTAGYQKSLQRVLKSGSTGGSSVGSTAVTPAAGSLADLEQQLQAAQTAAENAVGTDAIVAARKTVEAIKSQIASINLDVAKAMRGDTGELLQAGPEILENGGLLKVNRPKGYTGLAMPGTQPEVKRNIDGTVSSLEALGTVMTSLNGVVGEGAANWLQYGANVVNSIAKALPALVELAAAHKAEATASAESAGAGAASSVASVPFAGPALAVAAVASIVAALATVPKFAEGGIVGGKSYSGDKILARLNSGELVLNQSQQNALLSQIDRNSNVHITGQLKASGRDLQMTLDNYSKYSVL